MAESESRRLIAPEVARRVFVLALTFLALAAFLQLVEGFLECRTSPSYPVFYLAACSGSFCLARRLQRRFLFSPSLAAALSA